MKLNFKKIASVLAGTVMLSSTLAFAAAANTYPAPFIKNGSADVAVVYGSQTGAAFDLLAVADITQSLQAKLAAQTASSSSSSTTSISGEAAPLFTGGTKIYVNDTISQVKSTLTETELPTVLADGSFSGNVDATYTQTISVGSNPQLVFAKQPSSSDDPDFGFSLSTSTSNYVYNASVTFNKAVALNHSDSEGQDLYLFGQKFTIGSATDNTNLVLLKSAEKVSVSSDSPEADVTVAGKKYKIELISASDTSATVKVTDEAGASDSKEVNENTSKKIQGLTVAITNADENNLKYSASIIAGAEKVTLTDGSAVTVGENDDVIDGTKVSFTKTNGVTDLTKITVSVAAKNSDVDAIKAGGILVDPVFGSFKVDFASVNIPMNGSAREDISIKNSGDDKLEVKFADYRKGDAKSIVYTKNYTSGPQLGDNDGRNITVFEKQPIYRNEYVVVGNEDEAYMLRLTTVTNQTTGYSQDKVRFQDVMTDGTYEATITAEGTGTVTVGGKVYDVKYNGDSSSSDDARMVTLDYPDSTGAATAVIYPTIETSKGAKLFFYEPVTINISAWDGSAATLNAYNNLTTLRFPDGDGYTDITIVQYELGNFSVNGKTLGNGSNTASGVAGTLNYTFDYVAFDTMNVSLANPQTQAKIAQPALVLFEEKDDNTQYQAVVVTMEEGGTSDDGIGVNDVVRTWHADATWDSISLASNSKVEKEADLYGTVVTVDKGDSDQNYATISYPDEQVYAQVYVAANSAEILGGETVTNGAVKELGSVTLTDSQASTVSGKNLIVVGGSCVNTLAASLLSGAGCGSSWETATGVGAGAFLIQTFERTGGKVATLVAGYNAEDTRNAAKVLVSDATVDLSAGKKYKSNSATSVQMVTTA